jgi:hypothetical protein
MYFYLITLLIKTFLRAWYPNEITAAYVQEHLYTRSPCMQGSMQKLVQMLCRALSKLSCSVVRQVDSRRYSTIQQQPLLILAANEHTV